MSATVDQKAYLQKYLGGPSGDKKKKKKKVVKGKGFKIIDDDIDLSKLRPLDGDELDILNEGEDGPQIAGIIDDRPEEVKKLEQFKINSRWKVVTQDDGFNSKLQIEEMKQDVKETQKENELIFGKMYSDSEDEKEKQNDSDLSPPRNKTNQEIKRNDAKKTVHNSDSDFSPPRRGRESPPRIKKEKNYDSDLSPPRKSGSSKITEQKSRKSRWGDRSPVSQRQETSGRRDHKETRKRQSSSDSDLSPPRKTQKHSPHQSRKADNRRSTSQSEHVSAKRKQSPERYERYKNKNEHDRNRSRQDKASDGKKRTDSDESPVRKHKRRSESPPRKKKNKKSRSSSSDLSPPRKDRKTDRNKRNDSPPPTHKKMEKTLDGKKAGLQDARQLREENEAFREREAAAFSKMTDDVSGRNAKAVSRKNKRETLEELQKQKEKLDKQKELDEKYKKWSKGLKQIEAQEARMQDYLHEASKPLARHEGDRDLEESLRRVERDGDPMLRYIREKKRERGELGPEKPTYKGNFPPNRFNIRPGYRWDGVDRSNGYEKKYFDQQSKRKAQEEEAYKWSTEDL